MFKKLFGFEKTTEEDKTVEINVHEAFFRLVCFRGGASSEKIFIVVTFFVTMVSWVTLFTSIETYHRLCKEGRYLTKYGPTCETPWFVTFNNQILILTVVYLTIKFFNCMCHENNISRPALVDLQWMMASSLMPNSGAAFVFYYAFVYPGSHETVDIFNFGVWFCFLVMFFLFGIGGLYEIRVRHLLYSSFVLLQIIGFGPFVQQLFGVKVYNTELFDSLDTLFVLFILLVTNATFFLFLHLIAKIKVNKYGWTFTKIKNLSDLGDDDLPKNMQPPDI